MEDLTGLGPHRHQRVVAEDVGVAVGGALLQLAVDLADGRVEIDHHRLGARTGSERPGPSDRLGDHLVELADVSEGEGPQERAQRRRRHDPKRQNLVRRSRAQAIDVVDVGGSGQDRRHQGEHLSPRTCPADPTTEAHQLVHQHLEPQSDHEGGRHEEPSVSDQRRVVEGHRDAFDHAR
jgi:hypothetical protein